MPIQYIIKYLTISLILITFNTFYEHQCPYHALPPNKLLRPCSLYMFYHLYDPNKKWAKHLYVTCKSTLIPNNQIILMSSFQEVRRLDFSINKPFQTNDKTSSHSSDLISDPRHVTTHELDYYWCLPFKSLLNQKTISNKWQKVITHQWFYFRVKTCY